MSCLHCYHLKCEVATHYPAITGTGNSDGVILGILYKQQTDILM